MRKPVPKQLISLLFLRFLSSLFINKKRNSENVSTQKFNFERRLCAETQDLQIFKKFYMLQIMNPKEFFHTTAVHTQFNYLT